LLIYSSGRVGRLVPIGFTRASFHFTGLALHIRTIGGDLVDV
jgi:hypothetical protein